MVDSNCEIVWLWWLLEDMGVHISQLTPSDFDNTSTIIIVENSVFHEQTKHIQIDCHFTHHHFQQGSISLPHDPSIMQIAKVFTKALTASRFHFFPDKISMLISVTL